MTRFEFRYARWLRPLFAALGMGPRFSSIELDERALRVRMGVWFRSEVPRSSIHNVRRDADMWWAIGVHTSLRGRWVVNGSPRNTVTFDVDPPCRVRALSLPIKLTQLSLSPADPETFIAALRSGTQHSDDLA